MKKHSMKKTVIMAALGLIAVLAVPACELINAWDVQNPSITDDNLRSNATGGSAAVVSGVRRNLAVAIGIQSLVGDLISDNLDNRTSFYDAKITGQGNP